MKYRILGRTGIHVSVLGFGAMRLPTTGAEVDIDESRAIEMVRYALDRGVNYIDTAYVYHGGNSEVVLGKALADGYRKKAYLATKLPIWQVQCREDCDRHLDEQLARLQTDHIDFYLLHCLQKHSWPKMRRLGVLDWAERAESDGRIGHLGFSFHDDFETFREIVDAYALVGLPDPVQLSLRGRPGGNTGARVRHGQRARRDCYGAPFWGNVGQSTPTGSRGVGPAGLARSPVDLALQWLWNKPEVSLVLSGMSTLAQVRENIDSASRSVVGCLTEDELNAIARVREEYERLSPVPCTRCGYCAPCPNGVNIPVNFELYNQANVLKGSSVVLCRNLYFSLPEAERALACVACGTCEERCPQGLPIGRLLGQVVQQFK